MKTATEFFDEGNFNNVTDMLIEFAKMHVQEALKQSLESIPCLGSKIPQLFFSS